MLNLVRGTGKRLTANRVGGALTALAAVGCLVALATQPSDLGPTAEVLTPLLDIALAIYVISAIWTCVGLLKRSRGSTRRRAVTVGGVAAGLCLLVPFGAVLLQPPLWVIAVALNWPETRWPRAKRRRATPNGEEH
jgi:hypothetical protein